MDEQFGQQKLDIGFALDERYHWLRGEVETSKRSDLELLVKLMADVPYAIIGGIALQIHHHEPRTTLDIDLALVDLRSLPKQRLASAGFVHTGTFAHSENWRAPGGTPVQVTSDPAFAAAVLRAQSMSIGAMSLKVLTATDLVQAKLRAATDPARRRSKRMQDLADAQALIEQQPSLVEALSPGERELLK